MKKSITIIFGVMSLMFGLFFASSKIEAIDDNVILHWGYQNGETLMVKSPYLTHPENINVFLNRFLIDYAYHKKAIITLDILYVEFKYEDYGILYSGWLDTIVYERIVYDEENDVFDVLTTFYYKGERQRQFTTNNYDNYFHLEVTGSLIKAYGDIKYQEGIDNSTLQGYYNGYEEGISTVYYDGFGGFFNPDTNELYDVINSFPYNQGYNDGLIAQNDFSFTGILFQVFGGFGALLTIELLPNITIGAIVAVPLVFGIIYFILGKRSDE